MATAAAQSLHFAGLVREWARGRMTSRIQTRLALARELTGRRNRDKTASTRTGDRAAESAPLTETAELRMLRKIINKTCDSAADATVKAARMKELRSTLAALDEARLQAPARIMLTTLRHVAGKVAAPTTVRRYFKAQVLFLLLLIAAAGDAEELLHQDWSIAWKRLEGRKRTSEREKVIQRVAANHLAAALGAQWRCGDSGLFRLVPGTYVSYPTPSDADRSVALLATSDHPVAARDGAIALLRIAQHAATRPDERRHLRGQDIALLAEDALLAVSPATSANLKSRNSPRPILIPQIDQTAPELRGWIAVRSAALSGNRRAYLFADLVSGTFSHAEQIETLVRASLRQASGDLAVGPQHLRQSAVNRALQSLLAPGHSHRSSLDARNAPANVSIRTGHASLRTTAQSYAALDRTRRDWQVHLLSRSAFTRPDTLVARVLNKTRNAVRAKRWRRGAQTGAGERMILPALRAIANGAIDLETLVIADDTSALLASEGLRSPDGWLADLMYARCAGDIDAVAWHIAGCSEIQGKTAEKLLRLETGRSFQTLKTERRQPELDPRQRNEVREIGSTLDRLVWDTAMTRHFLSSLDRIEGAWRIEAQEDLDALRPLIAALTNARLEPLLSIPDEEEGANPMPEHQLTANGMRVERIAPRHFPRGLKGRLTFVPTRVGLEGRARNQPHTMFKVNVCALAALLKSRRPEFAR